MTVLIDPPQWPAHGTVFSHLVSDTSLAELHAFAQAAEISPKAFDGDHYDIPRSRYRALLAAGAEAVSGNELTRRLIASGLRIPARERPSKVIPALRHEWARLLPGHESLGEELLERWGEPHRNYHSRVHLLDTLHALAFLLGGAGPVAGNTDGAGPIGLRGNRQSLLSDPATRQSIHLAAWFHDAVYKGSAGDDEEESAVLAEESLQALPAAQRAEVARLVRMTAHHSPEPEDDAGAILSDADLSILGRSPQRYERYVRQVRADYSHVADPDFLTGRLDVVVRLSALDPLYRTPRAHGRWAVPAQYNLAREQKWLKSLKGRNAQQNGKLN